MTISAGELRHRITIERYVEGGFDEDYFREKGAWVEHAKIWAKITPLSAKDVLAAQAASSQVIARMMIRYRKDIDTTMRVRHGDMLYAIDSQALADATTGNIYCTFLLSNGIERFKD